MSGGEPPHVLVHTSGCGQHDQSVDVTSNICSPSGYRTGTPAVYICCGLSAAALCVTTTPVLLVVYNVCTWCGHRNK